ncbi:Acetyltransferase [Streptomyces murinus]|uniref:GNAT family N-acetyltransferase n=1 Tax=Streptomyces murinus TaxID=33900 RepID=UPI002E801DDC|nr:GNAT family N-acetyltransferase [Streptomyces murinus]WUD05441.1 GNAT family N-acetyltransferase [Streptomyces murinus]
MTDVSENVNETRTADLRVRPATIEDRPAVERLWLMFRHDMSEYQGGLPAADGTFRSERLESAFTGDGWAPYLLTLGDHLVGFAFVRGLDGPVRVLNSFFVVRGARRGGVGLRAVQEVLRRHPGRWEVAFQRDNAGGAAFWHRVAQEVAPGVWSRTERAVPGRPSLPADLWLSFTVRR